MTEAEQQIQNLINVIAELGGEIKSLASSTRALTDDEKALVQLKQKAYAQWVKDKAISKELRVEIDNLSKSINGFKKEIESAGEEVDELTKLNKNLAKIKNELIKAYLDSSASAKDLEAQYKKEQSIILGVEKRVKTLNESIQDEVHQLDKAKKGMALYESGIRSAIGAFTAFVGIMGVTSLSLGGIAEMGMKYRQSLFDVSKMQRAVGAGSSNLSSDIDKLAKSTNLSKRQFLDFASTMQTGFIGVRPALEEIANLSKILELQVGGSFEAQRGAAEKLKAVQQQFPDIYDEMYKGLELVNKVNRGTATDAEKELLDAKRENIQASEMQGGIDSQMQAEHLALLTPITESEKNLTDILQEKQKLTKSMEEAQIAFFDSVKPILLELTKWATEAIKFATEYKNTLLAMGAGLVVMKGIISAMQLHAVMTGAITTATALATKQQISFNLACLANPYVIIAMAIVGVVAGVALWIDKSRKAEAKKNEEIKRGIALSKQQEANQKDTSTLTEGQRKKYEEMREEMVNNLNVDKDSLEGKEAIAKEEAKLLKQYKQASIDEMSVVNQINRAVKNSEVHLSIIDKITGGYKAQIDMAKEFGDVNKYAMQQSIAMQEKSLVYAAEASKKAIEGAKQKFKDADFGITLNIDEGASLDSQTKTLQEALQKISSGGNITPEKLEKIKGIEELINIAIGKQTDLTNRQNALIKSRIELVTAEVSAMEKVGNAMQARLDTERQLMDVAQFGMGASVSMMQKQVELAYELMKGYQAGNKALEQNLIINRGLSRNDVDRLKNAKSINEVQQIANQLGGSDASKRSEILGYWSKQQELTKKSMEQQIKIYELTKEVREGYLDAIREMSTGAGEFEKIIGTQEVGVTQLMKYVDQFSEGALNSMKLGGMQSKATTAGGVGTDITGVYTAGGPMAFNMGNQNKMNERLYGWKSSMDRYKEMQRGEGSAAQVGLSAGAGEDNKFIRPIQEEIEVQKKGNEEVVMELKKINQGVRSEYGSDYSLRGVNAALYNGSGSFGNNERYSGVGFPMSVVRSQNSQEKDYVNNYNSFNERQQAIASQVISEKGGVRGRTGYRAMTDEELSKKYFELEKSRTSNVETQSGRAMREEMEFRSGKPLDVDVKAKTDTEAVDAAKKKLEDLKKQRSEHTSNAIRASKILNAVSSDNLSERYRYKTTPEQASKKMEEEIEKRRSLTQEIKKTEADLKTKESIAAASKETAEETRARLAAPENLISPNQRLSPEEQQQIAQQNEMKSMVSDFAQVADRVVPLKGETAETTRRKREAEITKQFSQVDFSKISPEQLKKIEEARDKASAMGRSTGPSAAAVQAAALEGKQPAGATSRAAAMGMESSGQAQAEYMSGEAIAKREMVYGSAGETASGGIGAISGRIVVELSDDLKGEIKEAVGIALSLQNAVSSKGQ